MNDDRPFPNSTGSAGISLANKQEVIYPQVFSGARKTGAADVYLAEPATAKLAQFFETKGLAALKAEDFREQWYEDWLAYQATHRLYATVLSPRQYSAFGGELDLLRLARFLEVFAYFSPSHGYSLQVTFLGLFSILMGSNSALKQEAVTAMEAGGLLAFGVSEKDHGSDLFANAFTVRSVAAGQFIANGAKYYIGNANSAGIISILARKEDPASSRDKRVPFILMALRPGQSAGFQNLRKIRTFGVRAAFVGAFDVRDHAFPQTDVIAEGRRAWDAVFGAVTLGKFFLGFGSIGMCEHAFQEALTHLRARLLYGSAVIKMPHIRSAVGQAYVRLTAMKLFAFRALDYVHAATSTDRRYLLFNAVQKARVGTEGVKVMALLSDCVGAMGFESDTYFEMALRDTQLIPKLEGSAHINLGLTARFISRYFGRADSGVAAPKSLVGGEIASRENPYLMEARTGALNTIVFPHFLKAYQPLISVPNVQLFVKQARAMRLFFVASRLKGDHSADMKSGISLGHCLSTIAYGQLIAENSVLLGIAAPMVNAMFHVLVSDLSAAALALAADASFDLVRRILIRRAVVVPRTTDADWDFVASQIEGR